jgi:hypothetical protein
LLKAWIGHVPEKSGAGSITTSRQRGLIGAAEPIDMRRDVNPRSPKKCVGRPLTIRARLPKGHRDLIYTFIIDTARRLSQRHIRAGFLLSLTRSKQREQNHAEKTGTELRIRHVRRHV